MVRIGTIAAAVGVIAGSFDALEYVSSCHTLCTGPLPPVPGGTDGTVFAALSVLLILVSLASLVTPRQIFYVATVLGLLVDSIELLNYSNVYAGAAIMMLAITTASAVLSLAAALQRTSVSEQSHPMNLPVFG